MAFGSGFIALFSNRPFFWRPKQQRQVNSAVGLALHVGLAEDGTGDLVSI